ncbi:MAG: Gldg family protein [Deltaproteobacteria bacterium]|nr:Gldg family protein [Deltaproteobacteria bacterium]
MVRKTGHGFKEILVSTTGLAILFVILILVNVIFSYTNLRLDTTEDSIYSLSQGSKNILSQVIEPVTVKFFWNRSDRNFPQNLRIYAKQVRDFLTEYEYAAKGRLTVEEYDPRVDSDEEEWAQKYGLQGLQNATGGTIYCGLVFMAADREEKIAFLNPGRGELLEYDITRTIHSLQSTKKKVLGIISSLPVFGEFKAGQPPKPWFFVSELQKTYEVREIDPDVKLVDPEIDLLLIIHPKEIAPKLQYAVDQYVLSGRNMMVFVDQNSIVDAGAFEESKPMSPPISNLPTIFDTWGVSMDVYKVVADFGHGTKVRKGNMIDEDPLLVTARRDLFNQQSKVTSQLETLLFGTAGNLKKSSGSPYEFTPLVQSGGDAALIPIIDMNSGTAIIRKKFAPTGERFNLVVQVRGAFKSAFPDGSPSDERSPADEKDQIKDKHLAVGVKTSTIIIIADVDMLSDRFFLSTNGYMGQQVSRMFNDNFNFVANACENLTGSEDMTAIRSRGKFQRPFTKVLALQKKARDRWSLKEQTLAKRAEEGNRKLRELEMQKDSSQKLILSPEQIAEIERFREQKRTIDGELKQVRKNLRSDIETLGTTLKAINIFLIPLCVSLAGLVFALYRKRRMKKS